MKRFRLAFVLIAPLICFFSSPAGGDDAAVERSAVELEGKLIAPCCWNSTLSHHFSAVAAEMKGTIRTMLTEGRSSEEILAHFEGIYGERVLAEPKAAGLNLTLWVFPAVLLAVGALIAALAMRRWRKQHPEAASTDPDYSKRIDRELYG